ncbi:RagB/SusD family nutrient uptake outer membrane protein [Chitinophaga tropicalis]|uniref:RagB/SusD family nutrient uptake outer membrane protein n=1 Tax=Chitinophaga tropicalis TaxID=2683588 RepID=A0A7K1U7M7_9BACT|nr:RagB/SusD family nutrient uptake outer membrane protein [Chitinophaga tropicalis]MVT10357.1 RagB/SusD family nutrient uptake outer membrane protein [Chitinophaga tropicalis]
MSSIRKNKDLVYSYWAGIILSLMTASLASCSKYLDVTPENVGTIDYAFRNRNEAENYLFACYGTLQSLASCIDDPGFITSGELYNNSFSNLSTTNFLIISGTQNTTSPLLNYWEGKNGGKALFQGIRRCNIMLDNIDKPIDLTPYEKERWIAEICFLKAYYHFYLLRMYGPVPIMDKTEDISQPAEEYQKNRAPVDSVFSYITGLLDKAIPGLPAGITNTTQEWGRITRTIALAVKAEVLATQASPLFNGNPDYADYKDKDGTMLFPAAVDNTKWKKAADAVREAISQVEGAGAKLYTFIPTAAIPINLNDSLKLVLTLQNAVTEKWDLNNELIWALNSTFPNQENYIPRLTANINAPGNIAVPLAITELFYTKNGIPVTEDKTWDYDNRFNLQIADRVDKYYLKEGYTTIRANFDREARYYADIAFDGGIWYGGGALNQDATMYVAAKRGDIGGITEFGRANVTGYWAKKLVHYQTAVNSNGSLSINNYRLPRIRLADLYLLYAECLNEANGPSAEAYSYIDKVRERAKLKGVVASWATYAKNPDKPLSKEGLREIIHRERRIELMFEGKAGWDLRRWKEYVNEVSKPIQGWNVRQQDINAYYSIQTYLIPILNIKDYLWPISGDELLNNGKLVQSPFWK